MHVVCVYVVISDFHSSVAGASISCYLSVEVILDHDDFLAAIGVGFEDALNRGVCHLAFTSCNVPSIQNKQQTSLDDKFY